MVAPTGKPSPRPSASARSRTGAGPRRAPGRPSPGPLLDPEAVIAVRDATTRFVRGLSRTSKAAIRALAAAARWLAPRLRAAVLASLRATGHGLARGSRWLWRHRESLARVTHRLLWWGALALLVAAGHGLLASEGPPTFVERAPLVFAIGLAMSVLVVLRAPEPRMRAAALALAGGHGALGLLAYLITTTS